MDFESEFFDDEYYDEAFDFGMDYLFSANVSACEYAERTLKLLEAFRKENSVVTFTFSDGEVVNTADIFSLTKSVDGVQIEFESAINNLTAQIDVFSVSQTEYEITMMLKKEELEEIENTVFEKTAFDSASKFFDCLSPKYGTAGEQAYALPADDIADDDFILSFTDIGYIDNCQYNMTQRAKKHKNKFVIYPLKYGEMYVSKDFDKELHRGEKKRRLFKKD